MRENNLFSTWVFTNPNNRETSCACRTKFPSYPSWCCAKSTEYSPRIRLVFKSECVSGPSSLAQAVQVGCRQHPSFLSLALWGNKVAPPLRSLNVPLAAPSPVWTWEWQVRAPPRGREEKRARESKRGKEWRNSALTALAQGVAGRYIACRVQRIIAALISAHAYAGTHMNTCLVTRQCS